MAPAATTNGVIDGVNGSNGVNGHATSKKLQFEVTLSIQSEPRLYHKADQPDLPQYHQQ